MKEKLMPRQILGIMEKHIESAKIMSCKNLTNEAVCDSNIYSLMSDMQQEELQKGRDVYYLDVCMFSKNLYFIIMDEFLYIRCKNNEYTIDAIMAESLYNEFRDLVILNKNRKVVK